MITQENKNLSGNSRTLGHLIFWQALTFSFYAPYWFYRNYKHFKNHKNLNVKAGWRALGFALLPLIVSLLFTELIVAKENPLTIISILGGVFLPTAILLLFWFLQIRTIKQYASEAGCSLTFSPTQLTWIYSIFIIPSFLISLFSNVPNPTMASILIGSTVFYVFGETYILWQVQKVLNVYWKTEQDKQPDRIIQTSVSAGDFGILTYSILVFGLTIVGLFTIFSITPLMQATTSEDIQEVRQLLLDGAEVDAKDLLGETALFIAVSKGSINIVSELIRNGANVNATDIVGQTPLLMGISEGKVDIVSELIRSGADVNAIDIAGQTPLLEAVSKRQIKIALELIKKGAGVNAIDCGASPLGLAVDPLNSSSDGSSSLVEALLRKGAEVNIELGCGSTPLLQAVQGSNLKIVQMLIENGANINAKDEHEVDALDLATDNAIRNLLDKAGVGKQIL